MLYLLDLEDELTCILVNADEIDDADEKSWLLYRSVERLRDLIREDIHDGTETLLV